MASKNICFIHSTHLPITGTFMLDRLLSYMNDHTIMDKLERIVITNIGIPLDEEKYTHLHPAIVVINYSEDASLFENATMKQIIYFSKIHSDYNVLYLHTKGVSYTPDHPFYPGILSWIDFMMYSLVDHAESCIKLLNVYDTIGTCIKDKDENPIHYSGNFWWAKSSYLQRLHIPAFKDKYDVEFLTLSANPKWFNVFTLHHLYQNVYPRSVYQEGITRAFQEELISL